MAGVVAAVGMLALVLVLTGSGDVEVRGLGDDVFRAGSAEALDSAIERDGPILFPDVGGRDADRPIYVHHRGADLRTGWLAVEALAPGGDPSCVLEWAGQAFVDPCSDTEYSPTDPALTSFPTRVERGTLLVDLRTT